MSAPYGDAWLEVNGCRLHYQDWACAGDPEAPTILLVHGLTQQSHVFDRVAARLAARYRCLALDVRGRGESAWAPPRSYVLPQYVDDVQRLLDALGLPAVHLLGTSMGGLLGMALAAAAPARLASLALNDIGPEVDPPGLARIREQVASVPARFPSLDAAADWAARQYFPWLRDGVRPDLGDTLRWGLRLDADGGCRLKFDPVIGQGPPPPAAAMAAAARAWWQALAEFPGPILLVRGALSDILSTDTAAEMARRQSRLVRVDVPGVGHPPTLDEPEAVAALARFYGLDGA